MGILTNLLAVAVLGGVGPTTPPRDADLIEYRIRFIELSEAPALHGYLSAVSPPIARQGGATVWAVDQELTREFLEAVQGQAASNLVQAPKLSCEAGAVGYFQKDAAGVRSSGGTLERPAASVEPEEALHDTADAEEFHCGAHISIEGRETDQGVLAHLTIDDTRVANVHLATVSTNFETVPIEGRPGLTYQKKRETQVAVPEVVTGQVDGEFLIPEGQFLLVSLGVFTVADEEGQAVVHDRLVMIEAEPFELEPEAAPAVREHP